MFFPSKIPHWGGAEQSWGKKKRGVWAGFMGCVPQMGKAVPHCNGNSIWGGSGRDLLREFPSSRMGGAAGPGGGWWRGGLRTPSLLLAARIRPPPRNGRCSPSAIYHHLRASEVCREQLLRSAERRGGTGRWGGGKGAGGCPVCAPSLGLRGRWGGIRRGYWGRGIDGVLWRRGALMGCVGKGMW